MSTSFTGKERIVMLNLDYNRYSYSSRRNVVFARKGMACSCVPLASQVGIDTMKRGGNAMDAAIAMAVTLPLVEPTCNGLGSDCFALIWSARDKKLYGLNGSGLAPMALSARKVLDMGYSRMPVNGWLPTMVPGAPAAWAELRRRFGSMSMVELMAPAIRYAREGYPVSLNVHRLWVGEAQRFIAAAEKEPEVFAPWLAYFTKDGEAYGPGDLFRMPDYAASLESLASTDCESFYHGELMKKIVAFSRETGGFFSPEDFENYRPMWVEPISTDYKGYQVFEMPPNGHGITALMALNILKGMELGSHYSADTYHKMIEAVKLAFVDAKAFVADPRYMRTKVEDMLSENYAAKRRRLIGEDALYPTAGDPSCGDTVYFCTADEAGNMVSFIQSNYMEFGSGVVIPGTGISLQNRGANFSLDPASDNCLAGGKRSYHTIIPGFLAKDGQPIGPFGVMGGFMQPQGHVQVIVNTVDYHMNPQDCLDAPRFQWQGEKKIQLEQEVPLAVAEELRRRGHQVEIVSDRIAMGRGQIIWRRPDGTLAGGTEPRSDGSIAAW